MDWWNLPCVPIQIDSTIVDGFEREKYNEDINDFKRKVRLENLKASFLQISPPIEQENPQITTHQTEFALKFRRIVTSPNSFTICQPIYELSIKQAKETIKVETFIQDHINHLMEAQEEEMLGVSLDGTPEEISSLVETHMLARKHLEDHLIKQKKSLFQQQLEMFHELISKIYESMEKEFEKKDDEQRIVVTTTTTMKRQNFPSEIDKSKQLSDLLSNNVNSIHLPETFGAKAKTIGSLVMNTWIGRLPQSLSLIGLGDEKSLGEWGLGGLPVSSATSTYVQIGTSLKISFRLVALTSQVPIQNILQLNNFKIWLSHAQGIYTYNELSAVLLPSLGMVSADFISQACSNSPEIHFYRENEEANLKQRSITTHSNLLGVHMVIRASDVKNAILSADSCRIISQIIIPIDSWNVGANNELGFLRRIKESLVDCATRRFVSGSRLIEIAFLNPNQLKTTEEKDNWLRKMNNMLGEVFE